MKKKTVKTVDAAHQKTDNILQDIEQTIGEIYARDMKLKAIGKEYRDYMDFVDNQTDLTRSAFLSADDKISRQEAKRAYMDQIWTLTIQSEEYNRIIRDFTRRLAELNQEALDVVNDRLPEIYMINYNQVAEECKRVGIKVYG